MCWAIYICTFRPRGGPGNMRQPPRSLARRQLLPPCQCVGQKHGIAYVTAAVKHPGRLCPIMMPAAALAA